MDSKHNLALSMAVIAMFFLTVFIIFGDNGLSDLKVMREGHASLIRKNELLIRNNLALYQTIQRLNNDIGFIENVAKKELGLIGQNEMVIKLVPGKNKRIEQ